MNIFDYRSKWSERELNKFSREDFNGLSIDERTIDFLVTIGLPDNAAPFVSFDRKELRTIRQIYSTTNPEHDFLVDIGFDGTGDPICIDIPGDGKIVTLDHENDFSSRFVNTSVRELFAFLTIFKDFGERLIQLKGDYAFLDSNFTDDELNEFMAKLKSVDKQALANDDTFWSREIETLKANREHKPDTR